MAGTFTWSGMSAGEPGGERVFGPLTVTGAMVIGETVSVALASGNNTIAVPSGAVAVTVIPPANNTTTLTFRTSLNSGDTGLPLDPAWPGVFMYPFPSIAPTSIIINAASPLSTFVTVIFI